jgi:tetratricopeptide (TPR) repeat protein
MDRAKSGALSSIVALAVLSVLEVTGAVYAADVPGLTEGERLYTEGNHQAAVGALKREIGQAPKNGTLHYYLANTYLSLNLLELALAEYQTALRLDPHGAVGYNSQTAIQSLQATMSTDPLMMQASPPASGGGRASVRFGSGALPSGAVQIGAPGGTQLGAPSPIQDQQPPPFMAEAQQQIQRVQAEANAKIGNLKTEMQTALSQTTSSRYRAIYGDNPDVKTDYEKRIAELERQAKQETDQIQQYADERLRAWQESMSR